MTQHRKHAAMPQSRAAAPTTSTQTAVASGDKSQNALLVSAEWLDGRIIAFVRTYLAIHENSNYVTDQIVEDPIAKMRFPKHAAETTLQKDGNTYYFISAETKNDFQNGRPHDKNSHRQETLCEIRGS